MQQLGQHLRDRVRTLFRIRHVRKIEPFDLCAPKPRIGAVIVRGEIRMTVQAGLSDELWQWLGQHGWREPMVATDRRHYRDIPASWVTRLFDAAPEHRVKMLMAGVSKATVRHVTNAGFFNQNVLRLGA
ncbi:MAG TPA: hypothetical protein PLQ67_01360 [Burkholderiaceae bacterium]|nr:hypothetical protein [Burkholderiaceae bacterium]